VKKASWAVFSLQGQPLCFFPKASTVSLSASTLQKEAPRFFIMQGEIVGGTTSQPRQFLLAQAELFYPFS
jgi:hypothetical protein